jgi:hypothetical protein
VIAPPPIQFDRTTGVLEGANAWERHAALALSSGPKVASTFSHRGYNCCANLLRTTLPERDIVIGSASAFWQDRIHALNANVARRMQ